ncbi:MAG: GMC family oxidoreductase N-terminal domain-containing protein [Pseudomonadota bacterium]
MQCEARGRCAKLAREARVRDLGTFDYVIVGAGTAGCVLANRLSADPSVRVLLLEAGGEATGLWLKIPVGYLYTQNDPRTDWCFKTEAEPGLGGRTLNYPRGRVIGGCSAINGMIYMRGQAEDYDGWRQMGNVGWGWDDVLPLFVKAEDQSRGADETHGVGGEWRVEEMRVSWEILDAWREAAGECGIPRSDDFNRGDNGGCGYFQVNQRRGVRLHTGRAFLDPVRTRANLEVVTHAQARRLIVEDGQARGIELMADGKPATATALGEVVLTAGAIGSPQLLELSGIGDGDRLAALGIDVRHPLGAVGENLQDHLQIRCAFRVQGTRTLNERAHSLWGKLTMGVEYALFRSGPLSMAPSQLGAFAKSDAAMATPDLQYHVQPLSLERFGEPLHPFPAFTASVCNLRPTSRGSVHITSRDTGAPPSIRPNYLETDHDRRTAARAIELTRRIAAAPALAPFCPDEFKPGPEIVGDEALAEAAGQIGTTIFHPVGTCRMGTDDDAVVDPRLRVRGLRGLRIADASVMPTITSGNTNAPTMVIAEKAALVMAADRRHGGAG